MILQAFSCVTIIGDSKKQIIIFFLSSPKSRQFTCSNFEAVGCRSIHAVNIYVNRSCNTQEVSDKSLDKEKELTGKSKAVSPIQIIELSIWNCIKERKNNTRSWGSSSDQTNLVSWYLYV